MIRFDYHRVLVRKNDTLSPEDSWWWKLPKLIWWEHDSNRSNINMLCVLCGRDMRMIVCKYDDTSSEKFNMYKNHNHNHNFMFSCCY